MILKVWDPQSQGWTFFGDTKRVVVQNGCRLYKHNGLCVCAYVEASLAPAKRQALEMDVCYIEADKLKTLEDADAAILVKRMVVEMKDAVWHTLVLEDGGQAFLLNDNGDTIERL